MKVINKMDLIMTYFRMLTNSTFSLEHKLQLIT